MRLTLGFSPCPNDTFIFDALVNKKIDTGGLDFDVVLEDVQTLNRWALEQKLDITKVSYGVLPLILDHYIFLQSGGALGKGVGPLLIAAHDVPGDKENRQIDDYTIAIPGENTTAHLLFSLAFPNAKKKLFKVFNQIEDFLLTAAPDAEVAGVIIHENRFTYQQRGLVKLADLGEFWEKQTGFPIPLGGIAAKRDMATVLLEKVDALIHESLVYAFKNYPLLTDYVKQHSQEMEESVMRSHIDLYVNNYSLQLGEDGKRAVNTFIDIYEKNSGKRVNRDEVFVEVSKKASATFL